MRKIIVTGANGFIGSSLIKKLIADNIGIVAIDQTFAGDRLPQSDLIERIETGIDDTLADKIPAGEYVAFYHLAWRGVNGAEKADPMIQLCNVKMAISCAATANIVGCKKFLCAGTIAEQSVKSLPNLEKTSGGMMYGVAKHCTHLMLENYCKNIGLDYVWMQFSNIYGIGNKTGNLVSYALGELLSGNTPTFGPASQPYDFIYVDDLIEAVRRLGISKTKKHYYYIGSGSPRILKEYLLQIGILCGMPDNVKIGVRPDDGVKYSYDMFDISSLVADIGEYVTTSFDEGVSKTIEWLNTQR